MDYFFVQGVLTFCVFLTTVTSTRQGQGYNYSPPASGKLSFYEGPSPGAGGVTAPGPITGPGPTGPVGPTGPIGPSAVGPGPVPYLPGPFPFLPFSFPPLFPGPIFPPYGHGHGFNPIVFLKRYIPRLIDQVIIVAIATFIVGCFKALILPFFGFFAVRMGRVLEDADQKSLDTLDRSVRQAIRKGACLERVACYMGRRANDYSVNPSILRMVQSYEKPDSLLEVFRLSASGETASCEKYSCWYNGDLTSDYLRSPYKRKAHLSNDV